MRTSLTARLLLLLSFATALGGCPFPEEDGSLREGLRVQLRWQQDAGGDAFVGCVDTAMRSFGYELRSADGRRARAGGIDAGAPRLSCAEQVDFRGLEPGRYALHVEGEGAGGEHWWADCPAADFDGFGPTTLDCEVLRTDDGLPPDGI